jgi:hypothetical protein
MVASAMLISAAHDANLKGEHIWNMSDSEVLKHLESSSNKRASVIARKIQNRKLFKPIYRVNFRQADGSIASKQLWDPKTGVYARYKEPGERAKLINKIERVIGLARRKDPEKAIGSVAISCPDNGMNVKQFDMLVLPTPDGNIGRLQDSEYPPTQLEIRAIQELHKHLWKLEVYIDPEAVTFEKGRSLSKKVAGAIQHEIGLPNEVVEFRTVMPIDLKDWENELHVEKVLSDCALSERITKEHYSQLKSYSARFAADHAVEIRKFLTEKGYLSK